MMNVSLIIRVVFRLAWQAMRQLHPEAIAAIQSKALFSQVEEALLAKISSVSQQVFSPRTCSLGQSKKKIFFKSDPRIEIGQRANMQVRKATALI